MTVVREGEARTHLRLNNQNLLDTYTMNKPSTAKLKLNHSNFFALRTPLLPWSEFLSFSSDLESHLAEEAASALSAAIAADRSRLSARLQQQLARPEVAEAVFIASPSLHESLDQWRQDPRSPRGQKTERALVRYFARMTARPTPFGLFAGCSVGAIGDRTHLELETSTKNRRHTRLDTEYILGLAEALARDSVLRPHLTFTPNTTLYRAAGQIRYAETRVVDGQRSHHLVAVDDSDYLAATLERAASGARPAHLASALVDEEITLEDATSFIDELIDSQLLESDLQPTVTGPEPIHALIERLRSIPAAGEVVARLEQVREVLAAMESAGHATTDQYQRIVSTLKPLPAKVDA
ncbi:MAG: lantibiotic dehydratase, partial [Pirellulales bacterium]|nr:lantibiotic dehydratase [Pirellulales bacterium]